MAMARAVRSVTAGAPSLERLARVRTGAVAPRRRRLRALPLRLHGEQLEAPTVTPADDQAVEHTGARATLDEPGRQHPQAVAAERRPRPSQAHDAIQVLGRTLPVEPELGGIELVGVGRLPFLRGRLAQAAVDGVEQQASAGLDQATAQLVGRLVGADGYALARVHRPRVEAFLQLHEAHA